MILRRSLKVSKGLPPATQALRQGKSFLRVGLRPADEQPIVLGGYGTLEDLRFGYISY